MSSGQGLPAWGHFCETRDMAGYPKIWTTLWTSPEFRALRGTERGVFMQLILWCKHERDDGLILAESYANLGTQLSISRQTASRMIAKLDTTGYTQSVQNEHGQLIIRLPMYDESQKLTAKQASSRRRIWPVQVSKLDGEKSTTRPEQTRAEQSKPSDMHAGTENRSPHARLCEFLNSESGKDYLVEARDLYPTVSISHEVEKAKVWVRDHPKRANKRNWKTFLTRWFGRAEESRNKLGANVDELFWEAREKSKNEKTEKDA